MLNIASSGNIQIKPPDNYAGRRVTDLSFDKAEDVSRLTAADALKDVARQQTRSREAEPVNLSEVADAEPQPQSAENFPSVLEEMSAQLALEFNRPLTEVRTPPMPYREFLDLLYKQPEPDVPAPSSASNMQDGLSRFIPLDMKV